MEQIPIFAHTSVLLNEAIESLNLKKDGIYIDGTFGRGGHSRLILSYLGENGRLIAIDKDPLAVNSAASIGDPRFSIHHGSFADIKDLCDSLNITGKVDGVLLDLGISSPQVDDARRGFSFNKAGPLDMRMDTSKGMTAYEYLSKASAGDLSYILRNYADESYSYRLGKALYHHCQTYGVFENTLELAEFVKSVHPRPFHNKHPATRTFQALRVAVNGELDDLMKFLESVIEVLSEGARLAIISFHSIEDRMVKQFFARKSKPAPLPKGLAIKESDRIDETLIKVIGKRIKPSRDEIEYNPRSRSAVMRVCEKLQK